MNCINCGKVIEGNEKYCSNCGQKINNEISDQTVKTSDGTRTASIVLGILSLVGVFLVVFSPLALIFGIIGLILAINANRKEKNTPGIIINVVGIILSIIIIGIFILIIRVSFGIIKKVPFDQFDINNIISEYREIYNSNSQNF